MPERAEPHLPQIGPPQVVGTALLLGVAGSGVYALATGGWEAVHLFLGVCLTAVGFGMVTSPVDPGSVRDRMLLFGVGGMVLGLLVSAIWPA